MGLYHRTVFIFKKEVIEKLTREAVVNVVNPSNTNYGGNSSNYNNVQPSNNNNNYQPPNNNYNYQQSYNPNQSSNRNYKANYSKNRSEFQSGNSSEITRIVFKFGLNLSKITFDNYIGMISLTPKTYTGINIGADLEIPLKSNFYLQPGIFFSMKGSKYGDVTTLSLNTNFIEVPLDVMYKLKISPIKILFFAGPYFAYRISGNDKDFFNLVYGPGTDKTLKPFDVGFNVGPGIEFYNFQLCFQYEFGLTNLAPITDNGEKMKTRNFSISLSYVVGGK